MKTKIPLVLSFAAGVALAAIVSFAAFVRWNAHQSEMLWCSFAQDYAINALRLSRGEPEFVLQGMEKKIPGIVMSVHSFGDDEMTRVALKKAKQFYKETGKPMSREIAGVLSSPRL